MTHTTSKMTVLMGFFLCLWSAACGTEATENAQENSASPASGTDPQSPSAPDESIVDTTPQNGTVQIEVNGAIREYRLYAPTNRPAGAMPLLVAVHGADGRYYEFPQQREFSALAEQEGFVIAYPLAELQAGNEGEWQLNTAETSRHDLDYIEALIDDVSRRQSIDPRRVYATGYSLGSMFTYELACHLSSRFAAVASFAGTMPAAPGTCTPEESLGVMHLHGVEDELIAYNYSWDWKEWDSVGTMMDIPSLVEFWQQTFECQTTTRADSSNSNYIIHEGCAGSSRVEHHGVTDVGHEWPNSINGTVTSDLIWNFLSGFSK